MTNTGQTCKCCYLCECNMPNALAHRGGAHVIPTKIPERDRPEQPREREQRLKCKRGFAWKKVLGAKRITGHSSQERMRVAEKSNATDNDMKLKKGQGNYERDLKTQFVGKNERVKEEKALMWRSSIPQKLRWSRYHQGISLYESVCLHIFCDF